MLLARVPAPLFDTFVRSIRLVVLVGIATLLGACQSTMSVEEAKKVIAQFGGRAFVPPPRTINDITSLLDRQRLADPDAAARARAQADQPPPTTNNAVALAEFYYQRGLAARDIGRTRQEIDDLTKALEWAERGGVSPRAEWDIIAANLAWAELIGGSFSRAEAILGRLVSTTPYHRRGTLIWVYNQRSYLSGAAGNLEAAEADTKALLELVAESRTWQNQRPEWIAGYHAHAAAAQGRLAELRGRYAQAEAFFRDGIERLGRDSVASESTHVEILTANVVRVLLRQAGRLLEAEKEGRAALLLALSKRGHYSVHTGFILSLLGNVLSEQGRHVDAETLARAAIDIYQKTGSPADSGLLALARARLGAALVALYRALLEPVADGWQTAESLLIVSHGALGQVPFALLPTRPTTLGLERAALFANYRAVPWLIRSHAVTMLPSVTALTTLRALASANPDRRPFVGFGDPYFSAEQAREAAQDGSAVRPVVALAGDVPLQAQRLALRDVVISPGANVETSKLSMLPRLPDTAEEIRAMATAMGADLTGDVFLGAAANERTVKTLDLTRYRVVAFATHGLVPGDLDGLTQPALALTAPDVAKVEGDGLLTMEEILALRLNADWVVLSACNTANGAGIGAEAISGLGRAFFYAGARSLLVTHWPVETRAARALTTELFRRQSAEPGGTRTRALQTTMNWLIDEGGIVDPATGRTVFSFAHPIFWAPFALVGDGG